jgi:hypothetical protein
MNGQNNFETAEAILAELKNDKNAMIANPATESDIYSYSKELTSSGFAAIPESYAGFLRICDGFAWNSFEFWGISEVFFDDDLEGYRIMDLLTMNVLSGDRYHKETDALVIYLGRSLNDIYIYNSGSGAFEIRNMKEFGSKALGSFD